MQCVYSVTIGGKNDCVVMTPEQSLMVQLKYAPDIKMYNMTERHGMLPQHLHKLQRYESAHIKYVGKPEPVIKGVGTGQFGAAADVLWEFEDLMEGVL